MKGLLKYIPVLLILAAYSCKKDNYSAPSSILSGQVVYKGEPIQLEERLVPYQIYQYGFGRVGPIESRFSENGGYSQALFDGNYKLIIPNGRGPFMVHQTTPGVPDSIAVTVKGNTQQNFEVTPYYMVRNAQFTASGNKVKATFKVEKIITDANAKDIEKVELYINKTQYVSSGTFLGSGAATLAGSAITDPNNISLEIDIPAIVPTQNYVFARVAVKIAGVQDRIYSPVTKVSF